MKALVLMSGGLDSTVCAKIAVDSWGATNVRGLSISYGQRHTKEILAADLVAKALGIELVTIAMPPIYENAAVALTNKGIDMPKISYEDLDGVSPVYVPFRNGLLLSYAAAEALMNEAELLYFGAHTEDGLNWAYPDCTPEFIGAMASAIYVGTYHKVRLVTPLQWKCKEGIVNTAFRINAPLELTWSCYEGRVKSCGKCPTCQSRIAAFKATGRKDPIDYEIDIDWGF